MFISLSDIPPYRPRLAKDPSKFVSIFLMIEFSTNGVVLYQSRDGSSSSGNCAAKTTSRGKILGRK